MIVCDSPQNCLYRLQPEPLGLSRFLARLRGLRVGLAAAIASLLAAEIQLTFYIAFILTLYLGQLATRFPTLIPPVIPGMSPLIDDPFTSGRLAVFQRCRRFSELEGVRGGGGTAFGTVVVGDPRGEDC